MFAGMLTGCLVVVPFSTMPGDAAMMDELETRIAGLVMMQDVVTIIREAYCLQSQSCCNS